MIAARVRALRSRPDSGFSIIEMAVVVLVTSIVLTIVGNLFVGIVRVTSDAQVTRQANGVAANVMNELRREIRATTDIAAATSTTPGVVAGTATSLTITSYADSTASAVVPTQVTFGVNAQGYLTETRVTGTLSGGYYVFTAAATTRVIAGPIITSSGLFSYADVNGNALVPAGTGLSATQLPNVATITAAITVAATLSSGAHPVTLTSQIGMPNLAFTGGGS